MITEAELAQMRTEDKVINQKGKGWYEQIAPKLEKECKGQFIVIDVESGEYVIADEPVQVIELADKKFGSRPGFFRGIGFDYGVRG